MAPSSRWGRNSEPITPLNHEENGERECGGSDADGQDAMVDGPADGDAIFVAQENHHGVGPFFYAVAEDQKREDRGDHDREDQSAEQGEG